MVPVGLLMVGCRWHSWHGLLWLIGFPVAVELLQAPIFSRFSTFGDVCAGWGGGYSES